ILVAATNRPDVLDPALLRPGRFDRQITVDLPDVKGREKILLVHAKNKPIDQGVDFKTLAARTAGFSGAELANLVNEAALLAARLNQKTVTSANFSEAIDKVLAGPERKSMTLNPEEKKMTAYHEAGHAIVIETLAAGDKVQKVSIMPRGRALGLTWHTPQEDRYTQTKSELINRVCGLLGGRVTEAIVYNEITTGAANDLERASGIVRTMICELGMSENLGPIVFGKHSGNPFLGKDIYESRNYSESVAQAIDAEIKRIVEECYARTEEIILGRRDVLDRLAALLEEKETIERDEFLQVAFPERYEEEFGQKSGGQEKDGDTSAEQSPEGGEADDTAAVSAPEDGESADNAAAPQEPLPEPPCAPPGAQEPDNSENIKNEE
ncbi:MAG: AAA family ATPase, partial [Abditibacteriota bacterium]|nr:AAA family ATPase [Abditibacteriota bacterium]